MPDQGRRFPLVEVLIVVAIIFIVASILIARHFHLFLGALMVIGRSRTAILITAAIAAPFTYVNRLSRKTNSGFQFASGVISLGFGLFLAYHIVFVSGLFAGQPQWIPH
jgi:hypothetical protein